MKKKRTDILLLVVTAVVLSLLYFWMLSVRAIVPKYDLQVGMPATETIISPISFDVLKPPDVIQKEYNRKTAKIVPVYTVSEDINFKVQKRIDQFFQELNILYNENADSLKLRVKWKAYGINLSPICMSSLQTLKSRLFYYSYISEHVAAIQSKGILQDGFKDKQISMLRNNKVYLEPTSDLFTSEQALQIIKSDLKHETQIHVVNEIAKMFLTPNLEIASDYIHNQKDQLKDEISPILEHIDKNQIIVQKNEIVTEKHKVILASLVEQSKDIQLDKDEVSDVVTVCAYFVFTLILLFGFYYLAKEYYKQYLLRSTHLAVLLIGFVLSCFLLILLLYVFHVNAYCYPIQLIILILGLIFHSKLSVFYTVFNVILLASFMNWQIQFLIPGLMALLITVIPLARMRDIDYFVLIVNNVLASVAFTLLLSILKSDTAQTAMNNLFNIILSCVATFILLPTLTPFLERVLHLPTKRVLLDLLDFNQPLMRTLSHDAPGTYQHSIFVGNLAESAAEAIGANPLLARVGSYYHDIGKLWQPHMFTENNAETDVFHGDMSPQDSAMAIKQHVVHGIFLAKTNNLPQSVVDIIQQHHGNSHIRYFLLKAKELGLPIDNEIYSYPGPKPQTKEAALVMISDIIESTAKSQTTVGSETLTKIIEDTINRLLLEGQLDDCPISMREINIVKNTIHNILDNFYRKRVGYPDDNDTN